MSARNIERRMGEGNQIYNVKKKKKNGRALTFSLRGLMGPAEGWLHLVTPF